MNKQELSKQIIKEAGEYYSARFDEAFREMIAKGIEEGQIDDVWYFDEVECYVVDGAEKRAWRRVCSEYSSNALWPLIHKSFTKRGVNSGRLKYGTSELASRFYRIQGEVRQARQSIPPRDD